MNPTVSAPSKAVEAACHAYEVALFKPFRALEDAYYQAVERVKRSKEALDGVKNRITRKVLGEAYAEDCRHLETAACLLRRAYKLLTINLGSIKNDTIKAAQAHDSTIRQLKAEAAPFEYPIYFKTVAKNRYFKGLKRKASSNFERELIDFVDGQTSCDDTKPVFSIGKDARDFDGEVKIYDDLFTVKILQDYELEIVGAKIMGDDITDPELEGAYSGDVFDCVNEAKFRALYQKNKSCGHDIESKPPDEVQGCLNEMLGKPVKIFDQGRCGICLENERVFALPCGCAVLCQGCVPTYVKSSQKRCPICRKGFALAACCQQAMSYEFSVDGITRLLDSADERNFRSVLDLGKLARKIYGTDACIDAAREEFLYTKEVGAEKAAEDYYNDYSLCGEEIPRGGFYLCVEQVD